MRCGQAVAGGSRELAEGLVQGGGECEGRLSQPEGDDVVGDGYVVPSQLYDVLDVLAEDDDQDCGGPVANVQFVRVDHPLDC